MLTRKRWTEEDVGTLTRMIDENATPETIATELGRSADAILLQARKYEIGRRGNQWRQGVRHINRRTAIELQADGVNTAQTEEVDEVVEVGITNAPTAPEPVKNEMESMEEIANIVEANISASTTISEIRFIDKQLRKAWSQYPEWFMSLLHDKVTLAMLEL